MDIQILIGLLLQAIFYGFYVVIFALYLKVRSTRKYESKDPIFYALTATLILCTAYFGVEMACVLLEVKLDQVGNSPAWIPVNEMHVIADGLYTCIDMMSQGILIYRCWVMWRQPWIVFAPAIVTLACLGILLTCLVAEIKAPGFNQSAGTVLPSWYNSAGVAFFSLSLAANAVATGLIVFKIFMVYRGLQTVKNRAGFVNGRDRYPVLSILVESGLVTFVGQLVQTVLFNNDSPMFPIVTGVVVMLYGISPTIVLVRVVMGTSYDIVTNRIPTSNTINFAKLESNNIQILEFTETVQK